MVRLLIAGILVAEGLASGLRCLRLLTVGAIYSPAVIGWLAVRGAIGALLFAGGIMLIQRRAAGPTLTRAGLACSLVFAIVDAGFGLLPTSVFPAFRWPAVAVYGAYAMAASWWVGRTARIPD